MTDRRTESEAVLHFWFEETKPAQHYKKDKAFDQLIASRFGGLHARAAAGELAAWRDTARGRLAEIIVLDQFSRNLFRNSPLAFAQDGMALVLAQEAIRHGHDQQLPLAQRAFVYMPFMHSESPLIQLESVRLFTENGLVANQDFAVRHKAIIDRFGRYPHRNAVLGRSPTPEEVAFLATPGSAF